MLLRSWNLEASMDQQTWVILDSHTNDASWNTGNSCMTFKLNKPSSKPYRHLRLIITGPNKKGSFVLVSGGIEFYGKLVVNKQFK